MAQTSGITIGSDALLPIARLFGLNPPEDAMAPPVDASVGGAGDPMGQPASSDAPAPQAPKGTKLDALRSLLNPTAAPDVQAPPLQVPNAPAQPISQLVDGVPSSAAAKAQIKPTFTEAHPILSKFLKGALGAAEGGLVGSQYANAGEGFQAAKMAPIQHQMAQQAAQKSALENMLLGGQIQYLPQKYGLEAAKTKADIEESSAKAAKERAEVNGMPVKQALEKAQTEAANYKDDPNLGLIDLRTGRPVSDAGLAPLTTDEAQVLGKQPGDRVPLKLKNTANEIAVRGLTTVNTEQGVFERNRQTGTMTKLGDNPRNVFAPEKKIIQVADPNNPGETKFVKAGEAVNQGLAGTQSASVVVPKNVLKWATTGEGGKQAGAFNTAMQHAELLEKAVTALSNNDTRTLNSIKNAFKKEFGSADVTNFQVISNAYSREITKMLSSGHMTDSEIGSSEATLPANASPAQLLGAINAYKALAGSKMVILHDQFTKGMKSQPNFPDNPNANLPAHVQARDKKLGVVY